jgi:hypothetical protein
MNLFLLFPEILSFKKERQAQHRYLEETIVPGFRELENEHHEQFDTYLCHKIFKYYALYVPVVIGNGFARLHGRTLSTKERRLLTLLGIVTPFFDDFFDIERLSEEKIHSLFTDPFNTPVDSLMQKAFTHYGREIVSSVPDKQFFRNISEEVFRSQIDSALQESSTVTVEENKTLTRNKGGYSLLFYYAGMNVERNDAIQDVVYKTGALLQLCNDIFDIYKDLQKGIYTLPRSYVDIKQLKEYFLSEYNELISRANALPLPRHNVESFLRRPQFLFAMTLVSLNNLSKLQANTKGTFKWEDCSRSQLIVDAEKLPVQLKWLRQLMSL